MATCSLIGLSGCSCSRPARRPLTDSLFFLEVGALPVSATARTPRRRFDGVSRRGPSPIGESLFPNSSKRIWSRTPVNAPVAASRNPSRSRTWRVGWTECVALVVRDGALVTEALTKLRRPCRSTCVALIQTTYYRRASMPCEQISSVPSDRPLCTSGTPNGLPRGVRRCSP